MIKNLNLFILILLSSLYSCTEKPVACFTTNDEHFILHHVRAENCSSNSGYHLWVVDDEKGYEDENLSHLYTNGVEGYKSIALKCYNKNGRKMDEEIASVYVGYAYVDSVIIHQIHSSSHYNPSYGNSAFFYIKLHGANSKEKYFNVISQPKPLKFTFNNPIKITERDPVLEFLDATYTPATKILSINMTTFHHKFESPIKYTNAQSGQKAYVECDIYWHFEK
jgi:hypothetical protein